MYFILLTPLLVAYCNSAPVRTVMCCCGCTQEPCPVVSPSCPSPRLPCDLNSESEGVECRELQQLWSIQQDQENEQWNEFPPNYRPVDSETGLPFDENERGSRGSSQHFEQFIQPNVAIPQEVFDLLPQLQNEKRRNHSQGSLESTDKDEGEMSKPRVSGTKKLHKLVGELQDMIVLVKEVIKQEEPNTSFDEILTEGSGDTDFSTDFTDEEEAAVDNIIRRMKTLHKRQEREMKEIDASISPPGLVAKLSVDEPHLRDKNHLNSRNSSTNCNESRLGKIVVENIMNDSKTSKRAIQKAAEQEFGGKFNAICSPCEFSFVISSQKYCEGHKDQIACFVYSLPPNPMTSVLMMDHE